MNGLKNFVHLIALGLWGFLGLAYSLKCTFGAGASLGTLLDLVSFWLWFAGLAAVTTAFVRPVKSSLAAAGIHAGTFLALSAIPRVFPLSLLRLGLDLLANR
ncbi:MAG TPA: hypothetical protein VIG99_27365 [Myxococcaceae bacterium]|jgi:hypothetical protein